jgi:hypothetical protein
MSNTLFVGPTDASNWSISKESFTERMISRWPRAKVEEARPSDISRCLEFYLPMTHSTVEGGLSKSGELLFIDYGDLRDSVELVLWYRSIVPSSQSLVFGSTSGVGYRELTTDTTAAELLGGFESMPSEERRPKD